MITSSFPLSKLMKIRRGNLSPPVITIVILTATFVALLLYTKKVTSLSSISIFRFISCSKENPLGKFGYWTAIDNIESVEIDDRSEFDRDECNDIATGRWVFNSSIKPLYTDRSCPYLEKQVTCRRNGRPDSDYLHWEWQPDDCYLPKFDPETALQKLQGKRLVFVGDSIQRGQWQSFVCMVQSIISKDQKSLKRSGSNLAFIAKEHNTSIEFHWAPFLVDSNTDEHIISDSTKRMLKVDSVAKHAKNWKGADILVFNSYVWWMSELKIKSLWGNFSIGEEGYEELERIAAYRIALKTWANWVDSTIDRNKTRVFFTTMSPTHESSAAWHRKNGTNCFNETRPITETKPTQKKKKQQQKKKTWSNAFHYPTMTEVVSDVMGKMKTHVTFLNITQLSKYRVDAHASVYTEREGKLLTEEQKADPMQYADCIHWCLPGVPDTWNQIFYAFL